MNKDILKYTNKLNFLLKDNNIIKEYISLKEVIYEDENLNNLLIEMEELKNFVCGDYDDETSKKRYYALKKEYDENYLVLQFNKVKKDAEIIFKSISFILSEKTL